LTLSTLLAVPQAGIDWQAKWKEMTENNDWS